MQTSKINVRIDSELLQRLRANISKSELNKRKFVEGLLEMYVVACEHLSYISTPSGYNKKSYYIIELKGSLKMKIGELADKYNMSISDFVRCALISWDLANK